MNSMTPDKEIQPLLPGERSMQIGLGANRAAARARFQDYRSRRAEETLRRQDADLALFHEFLEFVNLRTGNLAEDAQAVAPGHMGVSGSLRKMAAQRGIRDQNDQRAPLHA